MGGGEAGGWSELNERMYVVVYCNRQGEMPFSGYSSENGHYV
jgi:hypothetical protein